MRQKKIRGHTRRQKQIELWRQNSLTLDLDNLADRQRAYMKIYVHPWSGLSMQNSSVPTPNGKTKRDILSALLDIHDSWKKQLDKFGQPYYLKVWLFEPRFSTSQVVCAIGDSSDYYKDTFYKPDFTKELKPKNYGKLQDRVSKFKWDFRLDEDTHDNSDIGDSKPFGSIKDYEETVIWFKRLLKQPHRTLKLKEKIGDIEEMYFFKRGYVWVGGQ
jgi:hypothetical protein